MKISTGKRELVPESEESGREDSYVQDHAAMGGRDSRAHLDKCERVTLTVQASSSAREKSDRGRKRKNKRASRSPSTSSSDSDTSLLSDRPQTKKSRRSSNDGDDRRRTYVHRNHENTVDVNDDARKRSRSKTKSPTLSVSSARNRSMSRSPSRQVISHLGRGKGSSDEPRPSTSLQHEFMPPPPPLPPADEQPPPADESTTQIYKKLLMKKKNSYSQDDDALSKTTNKSKRSSGKRSGVGERRKLQFGDLVQILDKNIRNTDVSRETVNMVMSMCGNASYQTKKNIITETLQLVTFHETVESPLANDCPKIDERQYLFSAISDTFGCNFAKLHKSDHYLQRSLLLALGPKTIKTKDSLDLVFRGALKGLMKEIHVYDELRDNTLENPMFISARYLELTLIEKIRKYYKSTIGEDIIQFFSKADTDEGSKLEKLVKGCACEKYLRKLYDGYTRASTFDHTLVKHLYIHQMRVWTNRKNQINTNIVLLNYLRSLFDEMSPNWPQSNNTDDERGRRKQINTEFAAEYTRRMRPFFQANKTLLSEMLQTSELMAWACFGITMDNDWGFNHMALSYITLQNERQKTFEEMGPLVCWNFPLAMKYKQEHQVATNNLPSLPANY